MTLPDHIPCRLELHARITDEGTGWRPFGMIAPPGTTDTDKGGT